MKVLMVLTSHDQLGNTGRKTGFWLEELAAPYYAFKDAGAEIVLASPKSGQPPLDPKSNERAFQTDETRRFEADAQATAQLAATVRLDSVNQADFDTVFYPGGHGPLWDLAEDKHSIALIESFLAASKPVALVCHAPGVLRHVKKPDGRPLVEGKKVTGFANTEEAAVALTNMVPFLVEDELKAKGGIFSRGDDWAPYVVADGLLITGQNPASSALAARRLLKQLEYAMKAIGYRVAGNIDREDSFVDIELPRPKPTGRDILVEIKAVSVNPVDYKVRQGTAPLNDEWKVVGYDAAGVVAQVGPQTQLFKPGDEVFYAGSIDRSGTNAQFHLVDERIVGSKPSTLGFAEAAALPLTAITAWEALFDRLDVSRAVPGGAPAIVIVGGAGGVGSIAVQLARHLTDLTVVATASRPETVAWVTQMGAHHVIDHSKPLAAQVEALNIGAPSFVFSTTQTNRHASEIAQLIAPQGRFAVIDGLDDAGLFMRKSVSIHWELMFTRPLFNTADIDRQHTLLNEVARLVDEGVLHTTMTERFAPLNAANLKRVHKLVETGTTRGKYVLEGF